MEENVSFINNNSYFYSILIFILCFYLQLYKIYLLLLRYKICSLYSCTSTCSFIFGFFH